MKATVTIKKRDNQIRPELGWFVKVMTKDGGVSTCVRSREAAIETAAAWMTNRMWRS